MTCVRIRVSMVRKAACLSRAAVCVATIAALVLCVSPRVAVAAPAVSEDVPVPGGTMVLARALGIDPVPDRARFVSELGRLVYGRMDLRHDDPESIAYRLNAYLDVAGRFETALGNIQRQDGVALAMASGNGSTDARAHL